MFNSIRDIRQSLIDINNSLYEIKTMLLIFLTSRGLVEKYEDKDNQTNKELELKKDEMIIKDIGYRPKYTDKPKDFFDYQGDKIEQDNEDLIDATEFPNKPKYAAETR
jgi:hypothetical protein